MLSARLFGMINYPTLRRCVPSRCRYFSTALRPVVPEPSGNPAFWVCGYHATGICKKLLKAEKNLFYYFKCKTSAVPLQNDSLRMDGLSNYGRLTRERTQIPRMASALSEGSSRSRHRKVGSQDSPC